MTRPDLNPRTDEPVSLIGPLTQHICWLLDGGWLSTSFLYPVIPIDDRPSCNYSDCYFCSRFFRVGLMSFNNHQRSQFGWKERYNTNDR